MACADDICYVTGGFEATGSSRVHFSSNVSYPSSAVPSDAVLYFNMSDTNSSWVPNPASLTNNRASHGTSIVWSPDGSNYQVYVIGGQTSWDTNDPSTFEPLDTVEYYDPQLGAWQYAHSLPKPISKLSVASINQTVYAVGGLGFDIPNDDPNGAFVYLKSVYTLDTTQPQSPWQSLTANPLPYAVFQASLTSFGSVLFLTGGSCFDQIGICEPGAPYKENNPYPPGCTAWNYQTVISLDTLGLNSWVTLSPLRLPRCTHGSFFDPFSLSLFVAGGAQGQFIVLASVEVLTNVLTNSSSSWSLAPLQPIADAAAAYGARNLYGQDSPLVWNMTPTERRDYFLTKRRERYVHRSIDYVEDTVFPQAIALMTMGIVDETNSITSNLTAVFVETT